MEKKCRIIWTFKHKDSFLLSCLRLCNYCGPVLEVANFIRSFEFLVGICCSSLHSKWLHMSEGKGN